MKIFKNKELVYEGQKSDLSIEQIKEVVNVNFIGASSIIKLYQIYDGITFPRFAMMFRSKFYDVAKGEADKIEINFFLTLKNILELRNIKKEDNQELFLLGQTHIPFADDGCGNIIWVEKSSGIIKIFYHEYELEQGLRPIAPDFDIFCASLENWVL